MIPVGRGAGIATRVGIPDNRRSSGRHGPARSTSHGPRGLGLPWPVACNVSSDDLAANGGAA
jgi:hypothetical protein